MSSSVVQLGDLCDLVSVQVDPSSEPALPYLGLEHLEPGRLRPTGFGLAEDAISQKSLFGPNDVLYGKLRPYLDKAVLADREGLATTELLVLRPKVGVDAAYLTCIVHAPDFRDWAMQGVTGSQHPRTSWAHLRGFEIPIRELPEQESIARLLWSVHDLAVATGDTTDATETLKRAVMEELFTRGLRGGEPQDSEIGPIPTGWEVVPLGSLGKIGNGSTPKRNNPAYWEGGAFPWLTSAKMYDREITSADQFVTDTALRECHLPKVDPGAVLMAITGQGKTLGHVAVLEVPASVSQHVAYIQTDLDKAAPGFLRGYLETQYDYLRQVASGGGSTKGALTCAFLRNLPIPMPSTVEEQQEIVDILDALDARIDLHRQKRALYEELFQALLHGLMTQEISVEDLDLAVLPERKAMPA